MGEFGTVRRRVQKLQAALFSHFLCIFIIKATHLWQRKRVKKFEVQHFFSEPACNQSIVPPAHFTLCPKLDIHSTDLRYTLQKVAEAPWKVTKRSGAFLTEK